MQGGAELWSAASVVATLRVQKQAPQVPALAGVW
jgi:hypothetical protein